MAFLVLATVAFWPYRGERLLSESSGIESTIGFTEILFGLGFPLLLLCGAASTVSLLVRFRRAHGEERQQLKWFTYAAAAVAAFAIVVEGVLGELVTGSEPISGVIGLLLVPCIPIATGIAILKYRLYDIDRIINKTLVFGLLSAILVAGYAGGILLLQSVLPVPDDSAITVAASTLAMAALFGPLRRRIQEVVDRRFYRARYDAAHAVESFGARLRNETDLDSLSSDLLEVVTRSVQPAHASVWLRSPADSVRRGRLPALRRRADEGTTDSGGLSDLGRFKSLCPQLEIAKTIGVGHDQMLLRQIRDNTRGRADR